MRAFPGIVGLLIFTYVKPQEAKKSLAELPFLHVSLLIAVIGLALDLTSKRITLQGSAQRSLAIGLFVWAAVSHPENAIGLGFVFFVPLILYLVISQGIQTFSAFRKTAVAIFACGLFVAFVGATQGLNRFACITSDPDDPTSPMEADGRECEMQREGLPNDGVADCREGGAEGHTYYCEKPGLLNTFSVGAGRVRYLGFLMDPNELGLATSIALPFAFAFFEVNPSVLRVLLLLFTVGTVGLANVFTGSRGGQLVFATVLGVYFVKRFGIKKGVLLGAVLAVPLLLLGGRSGDEADDSTLERLLAASAGMHMLLAYPIRGVGALQFTEHHYLTAHNAYLLSGAELGFPAMVAFILLLYTAVKTSLRVMSYPFADGDENARTARAFATAMLATFMGAVIGVLFLSWTYHIVLWIHLGLCGALIGTMKRKYPGFDVPITRWEVGGATLAALTLLVGLYLNLRHSGIWYQ